MTLKDMHYVVCKYENEKDYWIHYEAFYTSGEAERFVKRENDKWGNVKHTMTYEDYKSMLVSK